LGDIFVSETGEIIDRPAAFKKKMAEKNAVDVGKNHFVAKR